MIGIRKDFTRDISASSANAAPRKVSLLLETLLLPNIWEERRHNERRACQSIRGQDTPSTPPTVGTRAEGCSCIKIHATAVTGT
jgi:hypothetical protein